MGLEKLDPILSLVPGIKKPAKALSFREKLKWTAIILGIYFTLFSTPALGVNVGSFLNNPSFSIINIIFAARIGTLMTVGIGPIVLSSIILQLLNGAGIITMDLNDPTQKGRFQGIQKLAAIAIAIVEAFIYTYTGSVTALTGFPLIIIAIQLALGAIIVVYLDEAMVKWGITSGINLFIAGGVAFAIVGGTANILVPEAISAIAGHGSGALAGAIEAFGPLVFTILILVISLYVLDMKVELPLSFSQFRGVGGGRLPIAFLYVSVLPVVLATALTVSLGIWLRVAANVTGPAAPLVHFFAYYTTGSTGTPTLSGGLVYLMQPLGFYPYASVYGGVGGQSNYYSNYFQVLSTQTSELFMPWGGKPLLIPEWEHFIIYTIILIVLCIIFGRFWVEMTGQSPKNVASQLQDVGFQIPGFRRDPRITESVLNKYLPTITVLGSIFVALLAAAASITGAIGNGMGILLTAGIMHAVYQQMENENMIEGYPALDRFLGPK